MLYDIEIKRTPTASVLIPSGFTMRWIQWFLEERRKFIFGRLFSFIALIVFGGLLQFWVVWIILTVTSGVDPIIKDLVKDGGLLFFSTSLSYSSLFSLLLKRNIEMGSLDLNITIFLVGSVTIVSLVVYSSLIPPSLKSGNAVYIPLLPQISCTFASVSYSLYVAYISDFFKVR